MPVKKIKHTYHTHKKAVHKHYLKVYLPYLPVLVLSIFVTLFSFIYYFQGTSSQSVQGYQTRFADTHLLKETNAVRTARNKTPLSLNTALSQAAQAKADDMRKHNYWSHTTPDGKQPTLFADQAGYKYQLFGENLAYGFVDAKSTIDGWMNSAEHRNNILTSSFEEVGFGITLAPNFQGKGQQVIIVALYGRPAGAARLNNTEPAVLGIQQARTVSRIQTLTAGTAPWTAFVAGLTSGLLTFILVFRHVLWFKKAFLKAEYFAARHPVFDIVILTLLSSSLLLSSASGFIH
jgi:uncharacterized protein YkwD